MARLGDYSEIGRPIVSLVNPGGIAVGTWTKIGAYAVIEALDPDGGVSVEVGDGVYAGNFLRLSALGGVVIEDEAMISDRVYLSDTSHNYEDVGVSIKAQGLKAGRRLEIGRGSWIGVGAAVVGGLRIGENAVVAANSVVRADVPDRTVVAGDPARAIRAHDGDRWEWIGPPFR